MGEVIMWGDQCLTNSGLLLLVIKGLGLGMIFMVGFVMGSMK